VSGRHPWVAYGPAGGRHGCRDTLASFTALYPNRQRDTVQVRDSAGSKPAGATRGARASAYLPGLPPRMRLREGDTRKGARIAALPQLAEGPASKPGQSRFEAEVRHEAPACAPAGGPRSRRSPGVPGEQALLLSGAGNPGEARRPVGGGSPCAPAAANTMEGMHPGLGAGGC
jgi:hypothetical protein